MSLTYWLVFFGLILTAIGGWLDLTSHKNTMCSCNVRFLGLSKQHYWNDGIILLLLAVIFSKV